MLTFEAVLQRHAADPSGEYAVPHAINYRAIVTALRAKVRAPARGSMAMLAQLTGALLLRNATLWLACVLLAH